MAFVSKPSIIFNAISSYFENTIHLQNFHLKTTSLQKKNIIRKIIKTKCFHYIIFIKKKISSCVIVCVFVHKTAYLARVIDTQMGHATQHAFRANTPRKIQNRTFQSNQTPNPHRSDASRSRAVEKNSRNAKAPAENGGFGRHGACARFVHPLRICSSLVRSFVLFCSWFGW